jgi:transposase-like protein
MIPDRLDRSRIDPRSVWIDLRMIQAYLCTSCSKFVLEVLVCLEPKSHAKRASQKLLYLLIASKFSVRERSREVELNRVIALLKFYNIINSREVI